MSRGKKLVAASESCPRCAAPGVARHRVAAGDTAGPSFEVHACGACGEYWVEGDGSPLTPEVLRKLGLLR